jgi:ribosomal-protein-alanine N-acetyltransferase
MTTAHAEQLFAAVKDPELHRWIEREPPESIAKLRDSLRFLEGRVSRDEKEYWLNWIAVCLTTGTLIGRFEITLERDTMVAFLAYTTFAQHQSKGYAKESCAAIIEHMFSSLSAVKVVIEMDVKNAASVQLAESLGAKRVRFTREANFFKGRWSDEYRYEILG